MHGGQEQFSREQPDALGADAPSTFFAEDDPPQENLFTAEIEGISESDWPVDASLIWGEDVVDPADSSDPAAFGFDFFA